jgi:hypothetical protein
VPGAVGTVKMEKGRGKCSGKTSQAVIPELILYKGLYQEDNMEGNLRTQEFA